MKFITAVLFSFSIAGCSAEKSDSDTASDTGSTGDTDTDIINPDTGDDTSVEEGVSISGSILFEDGSPAEGVQMRLCYGQCFPAMLDEQGQFTYDGKDPGKYSLQAVKLGSEDYPFASTIVTVEDSDIQMPAWVLPQFTTSAELNNATETLELANGLMVDADPGAMTAGEYTESSETIVKSAFVPGSEAGIYMEGNESEIIGVWYLGNFDFRLNPGWSISGAPELGLAEGDSVSAHVANFGDKEWTLAGSFQVDADGSLVGDENNVGLVALTTLVLTK